MLYGNGNGNIYGYDEFGEELYEAPDPEKEASNRYSRQGEGQPFGYTGYRYDAVGGTYFAQAREYKAELGRFLTKDMHWHAENEIYGDKEKNSYMPDTSAIKQSMNLYAYCMNNPIRYIDLCGNKAGDAFTSMDKAAKDFGKTINGKSIEESLEYGSYIYTWQEEKKILFITYNKTYYSYTEPYTDNMKDHLNPETENPPIPEGTEWVAFAHTHGSYQFYNGKSNNAIEQLNHNFSDNDKEWARSVGVYMYLAAPNGALKKFDPNEEGMAFSVTNVLNKWELPHDKNDPSLPKNHKKNCKDCYAAQ